MAFLNSPRFPDTIARGVTGGPGYDVTVVTVASGIEYRNLDQPYSLGNWDVGFAVRTLANFQEVYQFFHVVGGKAIGFRFKDFLDFEVAADESVLTLIDGETDKYQGFKEYAAGSATRLRKLQKLVANTQRVYDSIGEMMADWTVDEDTGIFTITAGTPPYTFSSEFDVPARFNIKTMQPAIVSGGSQSAGFLVQWQSIPIVEIRRPEAE
jgi:uncharacterized protein (TIGR02217 family)